MIEKSRSESFTGAIGFSNEESKKVLTFHWRSWFSGAPVCLFGPVVVIGISSDLRIWHLHDLLFVFLMR